MKDLYFYQGTIFHKRTKPFKNFFSYSYPAIMLNLEKCNTFKKKSLFFEDNVDLNNQKFDHVFFCAPLAFILKKLNPNHLKRIISYKRYLLNVLIKVNKKINFTEIIC